MKSQSSLLSQAGSVSPQELCQDGVMTSILAGWMDRWEICFGSCFGFDILLCIGGLGRQYHVDGPYNFAY